MRTLFLLCFVFTASAVFAGDSTAFTGTWKASQKGNYTYFLFGTDSSLKIARGADTLLVTFHIDTAHTPMHIDLKVCDRMSGEILYTNKGIFEWMGESRIRLRWFESPANRPQSFMPKGNPETLILVKQP